MSSTKPLAGKRVLVTGAGTGIGEGIAKCFADAGASVVIHYAFDNESALTLADTINQEGGRASAVKADLRQIEECHRLVEEAAEFLAGIDILVNNAGITAREDFFSVTPEFFEDTFNLNFRAYFFCAQQAAKHMVKRGGGSIINLSSIHGARSFETYSVYASTKGAINAFTSQLAIELMPYNIRVNAIAPAMIEVPRHRNNPNYDPVQARQNAPFGKIGVPEDVGNVALFLVSDDAWLVNGHVLYLDTGKKGRLPGSPIPLPSVRSLSDED